MLRKNIKLFLVVLFLTGLTLWVSNMSENRQQVFYILSKQEIIPMTSSSPKGFYIKGVMQEGKFVPESEVLGIGDLASKGRYGWLDLNQKSFFPMESDVEAKTPFVKGYMTDDGFLPSTREIFDNPSL